MSENLKSAPRCVALIGSYQSGKTSLMEAMLHNMGMIERKGSIKDGNTVGDNSPEARAHNMSSEISIAHGSYLDEKWTILDCPGSIEFSAESRNALMVCDMAVVVCEPSADKAQALAPVFHFLDTYNISHILFVNKIDNLQTHMRDILSGLQDYSERPLVLRQVPIREGDQVTGFVDLVSERAYAYQDGGQSKLISMPENARLREEEARQDMLEHLADFDDDILEKLLEEEAPRNEDIFAQLKKDLEGDLVVSVLIGSAEQDSGITRLMKVLRHECPDLATTLGHRGLPEGVERMVQIFKTLHLPHSGKISIGRVWSGEICDGDLLAGQKIGGLHHLVGHKLEKISKAVAGDVVTFSRMDALRTGDLLKGEKRISLPDSKTYQPVFALAVTPKRHEDEVKLSTALAKLAEDDPTLSSQINESTKQLLIWGNGDIHLRLSLEKLERLYNVAVEISPPQVSFKETILGSISQHARHKKQSGGHGEFGDIHIDIAPRARGEGFVFEEKVHGGSVPKQYIPAVKAGVLDYLTEGPLGFPVVDVSVTLTDGLHHAVDSSEMAFRRAGILAMKDGLPQCNPTLLEPVFNVTISVPNAFTSNAQAVIAKRRGHILGFDTKEGWKGWDEITAHMPEVELHDLIIDLRSLTQGVGSFTREFAHMVELTGRLADQAVENRKASKR
jgi:elongation factor G